MAWRRAQLLPGDVPVSPDAPEARRWATEELARGIYNQRPGLVQQLLDWIFDRLDELTRLGSGGAGWVVPTTVVLLTAVLVTVAIAVGPPGRRRRAAAAARGILDGEARTADQLRAAADAAAERGEVAAAVLDRFRALVRALGERAILDDRPGLTAHEAVLEAGSRLPALADDLLSAGTLFDRVAYGHREGDAADYGWLKALDARVEATRPTRPGGGPSDDDRVALTEAPR